MYRLQTITILSLLPIATLAFVGLLTLPWFQTVLDWVAKIGAVYFWIVFLTLIVKSRMKVSDV